MLHFAGARSFVTVGALCALCALAASGCKGGQANADGGLPNRHLPNGDPNGGVTYSSADATNCSTEMFTLQRGAPPDLLILLDRSGSMQDPPTTGEDPKWTQAASAVDSTVRLLQSDIKWGLKLFPTADDGCDVSAKPEVPIAIANGSPIGVAVLQATPQGAATPTHDAIYRAGYYLGTVEDTDPKYILLATDGEPNCSVAVGNCSCPSGWTQTGNTCCQGNTCQPCQADGGVGQNDTGPLTVQAIADVAARGIHTFIVGIATNDTDAYWLNQMALAGQEARPSMPYYYPVSSQMELATTISTIAARIVRCNLTLDMPPDYPDGVTIVGRGVGGSGDVSIPRDPQHHNGWDFGAGNRTIQFYGSWCQQLQGNVLVDLKSYFACPPIGGPVGPGQGHAR